MSQKTIAQLNAEIDAQITTNGANAITAAVMRPVLKDMADSAANVADGQTLYSGNGTLSSNRTVDQNSKTITWNNAIAFNLDSDPGASDNSRAQMLFSSDASISDIQLYTHNADESDGAIVEAYHETNYAQASFDAFTDAFASSIDVFADGTDSEVKLLAGSSTLRVRNVDNQILILATNVSVGTTGQKVGFFGATPVVRVASANQAVATDPTSTQTLANALRQALIDLGLIKGAA